MSKILEEYATKRYAEGVRLGKRKTTLKYIKNLMKNKHFSATEAMDALGIYESEQGKYIELL